MATQLNGVGRAQLLKELTSFRPDADVWQDPETRTYYVGDDIDNNPDYAGYVYQGTVAELRRELDD